MASGYGAGFRTRRRGGMRCSPTRRCLLRAPCWTSPITPSSGNCLPYSVQRAKAPVAVGLGWAHGDFLGEGESLISSQMRLRVQCTDSYSLRPALHHNYDFSWHVAEFFSPILAVP